MTATIASPGPSSGVGTSSTCRLLRGSFSWEGMPSNMPTLVSVHRDPPVVVGDVERADARRTARQWMASRISCTAGLRWLKSCPVCLVNQATDQYVNRTGRFHRCLRPDCDPYHAVRSRVKRAVPVTGTLRRRAAAHYVRSAHIPGRLVWHLVMGWALSERRVRRAPPARRRRRLRVHEVDPGVRRAAARRVVEQPHALVPQDRARGVDVGHPVGQLLEARARCGRGTSRSASPGAAGPGAGSRRRASPGADSMASRTPCSSLVSVCVATRPKRVGVPGDRLVEVGDGDAHMVDAGDQYTQG